MSYDGHTSICFQVEEERQEDGLNPASHTRQFLVLRESYHFAMKLEFQGQMLLRQNGFVALVNFDRQSEQLLTFPCTCFLRCQGSGPGLDDSPDFQQTIALLNAQLAHVGAEISNLHNQPISSQPDESLSYRRSAHPEHLANDVFLELHAR